MLQTSLCHLYLMLIPTRALNTQHSDARLWNRLAKNQPFKNVGIFIDLSVLLLYTQ